MNQKIFNTIAAVLLCLLTIDAIAQDDVKKELDDFSRRSAIMMDKYHKDQDSLVKVRLMGVTNSGEYKDISGFSGLWPYAFKQQMMFGLVTEVKNNRLSADEAVDALRAILKLQSKFKTREAKFQETKVVTQTYPVTQDDKLLIENRFGNITVKSWNKNEIKVEVKITGFGDSESLAAKAVQHGDVLINRQENIISFKLAKLLIQSKEYSGSQTDYVVYMPSENSLSVNNKFGGIFLAEHNGPVEIKSEYGDVIARNLPNPGNSINSSFGRISIQNIKHGDINVSHGNLNIGNAGDLKVTTDYTPVKIDTLTGESNLTLKFGNELKLGAINKGVKKLFINASYLSLLFGPGISNGFNYDITGSLLDFKYNKVKMLKYTKKPSPSEKQVYKYIGHYGRTSNLQVTISTRASSIRFQ